MKDENTKQRLLDERAEIVKDYERATQDWIKEPQAAQQRRGELAERLRSGYWQLDPYLRARSLYDRTGDIKVEAPKSASAAANGPLPAQQRDDDLD